MRNLGVVLVDEAHRQAWSTRPEIAARMNPQAPADAGYVTAAETLRTAGYEVRAHEDGLLTPEALADVDVLVIPHCSDEEWETTTGVGSPIHCAEELAAIEDFVAAGGGLIVLAETEQKKYGNVLGDLAGRFGIEVVSTTVQDPVHRFKDVSTWVLGQPGPKNEHDLLTEVSGACFYRAGVLQLNSPKALPVLVTSSDATVAGAPLIAAVPAGAGRVVVAADSDLFGDDSIADLEHRRLWLNLVTWAGTGRAGAASSVADASGALQDPAWDALVAAIEELRPLQAKDGSVGDEHRERAGDLVAEIAEAVTALSPRFPHQKAHLEATVTDFLAWRDAGLGVPDFLDSLLLFHPEQERRDGVEHLAVFPMYTQNGNPNRNVEAVITRTVWPDWIAQLEAGDYDNPAFVPIEFVGFTKGYDTHSAVLFPETVATRETAKFTWGGIFCDREAARFRRVSAAAADVLQLSLPPDAERLLADQRLAQETFILWDLVHDRTHSHGDLPFDPFMIKQRMPYWMYGLEELRCDLTTFRETPALEAQGATLARHVRIAILFDRLFRFPTTGERVRNYDGLGGQILFAWLHRNGVLRWRDNTLSLDWPRVYDSVSELCGEVETLYNEGIDRSRMGHWLAAHTFVSGLVPPNPASVWAQGAQALPTEPRLAVDEVLPDEFPLNVFYEALRKKLAPVIESTRGITGVSG